jgi:hypothetical protein
VPVVAVGAVGTPVSAGEFSGAKLAVSDAISALTKAVVATCVVFVPVPAVGAVGAPVNAGELNGDARDVIALAPCRNRPDPVKPRLSPVAVDTYDFSSVRRARQTLCHWRF